MEKAFENGCYETLSPLELSLLIALNDSENSDIARKKVGLSIPDTNKILEKLNDLHLINWYVGITGYQILPELSQALKGLKILKGTKSIFGSPKAQDLYKMLKRKHLFVYPEIPICAFIIKEYVKHLFTEDWHKYYFLTARVDFVVCDPYGNPKFAVEYQGGYHESTDQKERDDFKKLIINEAGISLLEIKAKDLRCIDSFL